MLFSKNKNPNIVTGVGSGLVDFLVHADDNFIVDIGVKKGGMTLVDMNTIKVVLDKIPCEAVIVPGGAACNTIVGVGQLGAFARFIGKLGIDENGRFFKNALINRNVEPSLLYSESPTGRVLSIITPDAQRTMLTCLGASSEILPKEITSKYFEGSKIVHIEGYLLFNLEVMFAILEAAKSSGALISLDLASFTVVDETLEILNYLIPKYVDILVGNEDEVIAYTGLKDEKLALKAMAEHVSIAALKVGHRGSYIIFNDIVLKIPPLIIEAAVDTTGAGDLWAAGLLFGIVNDLPLKKCGEIASMCGGEVCKVVGADIPDESWYRIRDMISRL